MVRPGRPPGQLEVGYDDGKRAKEKARKKKPQTQQKKGCVSKRGSCLHSLWQGAAGAVAVLVLARVRRCLSCGCVSCGAGKEVPYWSLPGLAHNLPISAIAAGYTPL